MSSLSGDLSDFALGLFLLLNFRLFALPHSRKQLANSPQSFVRFQKYLKVPIVLEVEHFLLFSNVHKSCVATSGNISATHFAAETFGSPLDMYCDLQLTHVDRCVKKGIPSNHVGIPKLTGRSYAHLHPRRVGTGHAVSVFGVYKIVVNPIFQKRRLFIPGGLLIRLDQPIAVLFSFDELQRETTLILTKHSQFVHQGGPAVQHRSIVGLVFGFLTL